MTETGICWRCTDILRGMRLRGAELPVRVTFHTECLRVAFVAARARSVNA